MPQRAAAPYVSQYSGEQVSMTLPPKEYGSASTTHVDEGKGESVTVLPAIEYSEYKRRERQGQQYEVRLAPRLIHNASLIERH
jgi:hypothetical protein